MAYTHTHGHTHTHRILYKHEKIILNELKLSIPRDTTGHPPGKPLHGITKEKTKFPPPFPQTVDYNLSDTKEFLSIVGIYYIKLVASLL